MRPILPSQEDEWKLMVDQDPHSGSVVGDSGHETMVMTSGTEPVDSSEELIGAVGGTDENISVPLLTNVISWIKYEAQNMMEPTWSQELKCIREVDHLRYIITMLVWFHRWRQEHGLWPSLPACGFQVTALATATTKT